MRSYIYDTDIIWKKGHTNNVKNIAMMENYIDNMPNSHEDHRDNYKVNWKQQCDGTMQQNLEIDRML